MEKLRVNDTPVRTARNFLINNIEIELEMPEKIAEFKNVEIINDKSVIDNEVSNTSLTYGTGKILEELNYETANSKIRIQTSNKKEDIRIRYNFVDNNVNLINQIEIIANGDTNVIIEYKHKFPILFNYELYTNAYEYDPITTEVKDIKNTPIFFCWIEE